MRILVALFLVINLSNCKVRQVSNLYDGPSSAERGFPNYFEQTSKSEFHRALVSIANRLMLVVYENKQGSLRPFLQFINQRIKQKYGQQYEMMPAYGVTRTMVGYLYAEIHKQKLKHPRKPVSHLLQEIINSREPIPALKVRGVGSDLDFAVRQANGRPVDNNVVESIKQDIVNMLLDPSLRDETKAGKTLDRTFFVAPDVKEHLSQVGRSREQGGSEIDMIALSLDQGKLIEPDFSDRITRDILGGTYVYSDGSKQGKDTRQKQTVRGLRALVELPWLSLNPKSEALLLSELSKLTRDLQRDGNLSDKAVDQFDKLTRNSWFSGANNRLWRNEPIASAVRHFNLIYHKKTNKYAIPIFVQYEPVENRIINSDIPRHLLMTPAEFIRDHTDAGKLHHSTTTAGLAILRQGLLLSGKGQGSYSEGPGVYTSKSLEFIAKISDTRRKWVFDLTVSDDQGLRTFNYEKHKNDPWVKRKLQELGGRNQFFNYLRVSHAVDVIINTHILVQNAAILEYPTSLSDLYAASMLGAKTNFYSFISRIKYVENLYQSIKLSGESTRSNQTPTQFLTDIAQNIPKKQLTAATLGAILVAKIEGILPKKIDHLIEIEPLLEAGADPNTPGYKGRSSLFTAVVANRLDLVRSLLKAGGDPNTLDDNNQSPMIYARDGAIITALYEAGGNINTQDNNPLLSASFGSNIDVFRSLINAGANPNIQDKLTQQTALHRVISRSNLEIAEILLEAGADPNIPDKEKQTPLNKAIRKNDLTAVKILISFGADPFGVNIKDLSELSVKNEILNAQAASMHQNDSENGATSSYPCKDLRDSL